MNNKGVFQFTAPVIVFILFIIVFIVSVIGTAKIFGTLRDLPGWVWYGVVAIILYSLFRRNK